MNKKVTSDLRPTAMNCPNLPGQRGKWMVFFVLNDVEFVTSPCYTEEEARAIMRRVSERVTEWTDAMTVWVEEPDDVETADR